MGKSLVIPFLAKAETISWEIPSFAISRPSSLFAFNGSSYGKASAANPAREDKEARNSKGCDLEWNDLAARTESCRSSPEAVEARRVSAAAVIERLERDEEALLRIVVIMMAENWKGNGKPYTMCNKMCGFRVLSRKLKMV